MKHVIGELLLEKCSYFLFNRVIHYFGGLSNSTVTAGIRSTSNLKTSTSLSSPFSRWRNPSQVLIWVSSDKLFLRVWLFFTKWMRWFFLISLRCLLRMTADWICNTFICIWSWRSSIRSYIVIWYIFFWAQRASSFRRLSLFLRILLRWLVTILRFAVRFIIFSDFSMIFTFFTAVLIIYGCRLLTHMCSLKSRIVMKCIVLWGQSHFWD